MFNPTYPPTNALIESAQFNGLVDLIAAVPTITGAQVDAVNTLPPGDPAISGLKAQSWDYFLVKARRL